MTRAPVRWRGSPALQPAAVNALDALAARIAVVDLEGRLVLANRTWWSQQAAAGAAIQLGQRYTVADDLGAGVDAQHLVIAQELLRDVLTGRRVQADLDYRVDGPGIARWYNVEIMPVREQGTLVGAIVSHNDITLRKRAELGLDTLAVSDGLTGLPNRCLAEQAIERHLSVAGGPGRVAVVLLDLHGFNLVNDSMGHAAGDLLLLDVSQRLRAHLGRGQLLSRLAGDEFAVVCPGPIDAVGAMAEAQGLTTTLARPFATARGEVSITASLGVAVDTGPGSSAVGLLGDAHAAMQRASELGPGRVEVADERLRRRATRKLQTATGLHQALQRDEFRLHYQPVVELGTGRVLGAEALLRWAHPQHGLIRAADFIDIVEDSGLILPVGRWVTQQVCRHLRAWQAARPESQIAIAFNLSPRQLADASLVATVEEAISESGCDPRALVIEITEGLLAHDEGESTAALARLVDLGVSLSIDDFGTGYSSLKRLQEISVHGIKIDRTFVAGVSEAGRERVIVDATVNLARALGIRVIAEGVETVEQAQHLADTGAVEAQGWLWSTALSPADFTALLRSGACLPRRANAGA